MMERKLNDYSYQDVFELSYHLQEITKQLDADSDTIYRAVHQIKSVYMAIVENQGMNVCIKDFLREQKKKDAENIQTHNTVI